ncbi:hypothetical protein JNUCC1_03689 [Lentibacillus sp. JNUCC-1]|nr:hypothetical protein [Lentibacillus sp. JNUCC-1]
MTKKTHDMPEKNHQKKNRNTPPLQRDKKLAGPNRPST